MYFFELDEKNKKSIYKFSELFKTSLQNRKQQKKKLLIKKSVSGRLRAQNYS